MTVIQAPKADQTADASPPAAPRPDVDGEPTVALFPEAKRRERRRRLFVLAIVAVALGGAGVGYALSSGRASPGPHSAAPRETASQPTWPTAVGAPLKHPYGLAIAKTGDLYIVDTARDQVLGRLPSGRFHVIAGDGHRGFSGDGGPATDAELDLGPRAGLAIAKNGTLYIADSGNDRVRAVLADGTIKTVAGDGTSGSDYGLVLHTTSALEASFGAPSGLAVGPNGDLYIAAGNVVRLTPSGLIQWVAGTRGPLACGSIYCNPASEADFSEPDQLAFDGAGDLFVSDNNGLGLYEVAANGHLRYLGQFRGDPSGALAEAADGTVVEADRAGLARLPANGKIKIPKHQPHTLLAPGEDIPGDLDRALGRNKLLGGYNAFIAGDGVAVAPNGAVYADTNTGNTFTSVSALVEVKPGGKVLTLWKS
jgi:hypothetical protein